MSDTPSFATPQEEVMYWKKCLEDKQQEVDDLEQNFNEYQEFSKQLEEEMETELRACEKKHTDLVSQHARLKNDYENIQDKLNGVSRESSSLIASLQDEVDKLKHFKQSLLGDKRKLEQENDTLERRERASSASVQDLSEKLDRVMEENVWMQSELEESKQNADETIQRLREEMRELKQDISVKDNKKILIKPIPTEVSKLDNTIITIIDQQPNNNNNNNMIFIFLTILFHPFIKFYQFFRSSSKFTWNPFKTI
ncbi:Lis-interacting protein [Cavenderia fasciculata]|uniref:Lis-interacting protein n=1 Tax=Cavenderia fasciculata TaxID=261658 RepID=F4Q624_CACFS|nr:Lis-interacting protein [Cavenderia fasciculata]EGG16610.1 Lis-interacting protein [Cavenderia fasciculata]|eukprot:XP_004355084.1 Lis-interacting protein [Cavenderia fasciculata]